MKNLLLMFFAGFVFCDSGIAQADIVIVFSDGSTTGTNFNVAVNSTNTFFVSVMETDPNDELSNEGVYGGLVGFGLTADYSALSGTVGEVTANMVDGQFDTPMDESFSATNLNLAGIDIDFASDGRPFGTTIVLGQFDVSVTAAGVTEFVFDDYSALSDFVTFKSDSPPDNDPVDLDPIIFADGRTFAMTISAVPEPGSLTILSLIGLGVLTRRRRCGA